MNDRDRSSTDLLPTELVNAVLKIDRRFTRPPYYVALSTHIIRMRRYVGKVFNHRRGRTNSGRTSIDVLADR